MAKLDRSKENALLAALGSPVRRQLLRRMRDGKAVSPAELAKEFKLPLSTIAYHVKVLAHCGAVTLVRVKPAQGSLRHFYRSSLKPPWAQQIIDLEPWDEGASGEISDNPSA